MDDSLPLLFAVCGRVFSPSSLSLSPPHTSSSTPADSGLAAAFEGHLASLLASDLDDARLGAVTGLGRLAILDEPTAKRFLPALVNVAVCAAEVRGSFTSHNCLLFPSFSEAYYYGVHLK